jgi:hypothetical protein
MTGSALPWPVKVRRNTPEAVDVLLKAGARE